MTGLTAEDLIACYKRGVFPMAEARDDERVFLIDPEQRGIMPLDRFHIPRRLARTVRQAPYEVRIDTAFEAVIEACAASAEDRPETWINASIQHLYRELFVRGQAHTVECWEGERLVGGLYGVSIGGAFFGESMFSAERDASKVGAGAPSGAADRGRLRPAGRPVHDRAPVPSSGPRRSAAPTIAAACWRR